MAQSFAATITNAKHVSMACALIDNGKPTDNTLFHMKDMTHGHIDQDKQKENLLRRLLLFAEEDKHEQPTTIALLQTSSILRQKASLYEMPHERYNHKHSLIQSGRSPVGEYNYHCVAI